MKNFASHEISAMQDAISVTMGAIHTAQMSLPHIQDKTLKQLVEKQLQFLQEEYNKLVGLLNQQSTGQGQTYKAPANFQPKYGLTATTPKKPNQSAKEITDEQLSAILLGTMKSSAITKFQASIEAADATWRNGLIQCATSCSEMSYEIWQYMNQNGYYQLPTLQQEAQQTIAQSYVSLVHQ
jgi:spore coat protein CotF